MSIVDTTSTQTTTLHCSRCASPLATCTGGRLYVDGAGLPIVSKAVVRCRCGRRETWKPAGKERRP